MGGSTGTDAEGSSDMGSGSDDMMSGDKPEVSEGHSEVDPNTVEASEGRRRAGHVARRGRLGNVSEVLLTEDGSIESIVVNVGGVLGIGSKPVEVPFDEVTLQRNDEDDELSIIIPMSEQELEDMPEYEEKLTSFGLRSACRPSGWQADGPAAIRPRSACRMWPAWTSRREGSIPW